MHADVFAAEKLWSHQQAQIIRVAERRRIAPVRAPRLSADLRLRVTLARRFVGHYRRFGFARFARGD